MFEKFMNQEHGLVITMNWITDCLFLSMLWMVFSVFVIPLGPASAALYDTVVHVFRRGEKIVYRRFFESMKKNMKVGIPAGIVSVVTGVLGFHIWNRIGVMAENSQIGYVLLWGFFVLFLFVLGMICFLFPLLSRFETGLFRLFSNCIIMSIVHLPMTVALSLISAVTVWLCLWLWWPVIFIPCVSAIMISFFVEPVFELYMKK